jgi:hypothetical protein
MAIDLLALQPHKVSRDLSGYITYIYGRPKTGKTTLAVQAPGALLLAFERGYNAIPGVIAQDVNSWADLKQIVRELKKAEVRAVYKTLIVDTVDIAADYCQAYICNQLGIDNIGDGGWTNNGWAKYKKEFEDVFRSLTMLGYAVIFISHSKEKSCKRKDGSEYTQITPSLQTSANSIVENMADIYAYAHPERIDGVPKVVLTMRHEDDTIFCGGRFKYIDSMIEFNYDSLVKALNDAIDREAEAIKNPSLFTQEREVVKEKMEYDYEALMTEFSALVSELMAKDKTYYTPRVTAVVERYLGKGKKVSETSILQAEFIYLINNEIKEDLMNS